MSSGIDVDSHIIKWDLVLCLLLAWIFIFFCTIGGVKSSGKVRSCNRKYDPKRYDLMLVKVKS